MADKDTAQSVGNPWGLCCPKCGHGQGIRVVASVWVELTPEGSSEGPDSNHKWDDNSSARCTGDWPNLCDWSGTVAQLIKVEIEE